MNDDQVKKVRMMEVVQKTLDDFTPVWNPVPVNVTMKNELDEILQRTKQLAIKATGSSKGTTRTKEELRKQLALKAMVVIGILRGYANVAMDNNLLELTTITKSDLDTNLRENEIDPVVTNVLKKIRELLETLAPYGLTEDMIVEVETTLDDFNALIGKPIVLRNRKFEAIGDISELVKAGMDLLNNRMDPLFFRYSLENPEFYKEYKRARTIID